MRESHVVPATIHNSHSSGFSCERYGRRRQHERQAKRERGDKCSRGTERRATWQRKIVIKAKYKEETRNSMKNQQQQHSPAIASLDFYDFQTWVAEMCSVGSVDFCFVLRAGMRTTIGALLIANSRECFMRCLALVVCGFVCSCLYYFASSLWLCAWEPCDLLFSVQMYM